MMHLRFLAAGLVPVGKGHLGQPSLGKCSCLIRCSNCSCMLEYVSYIACNSSISASTWSPQLEYNSGFWSKVRISLKESSMVSLASRDVVVSRNIRPFRGLLLEYF